MKQTFMPPRPPADRVEKSKKMTTSMTKQFHSTWNCPSNPLTSLISPHLNPSLCSHHSPSCALCPKLDKLLTVFPLVIFIPPFPSSTIQISWIVFGTWTHQVSHDPSTHKLGMIPIIILIDYTIDFLFDFESDQIHEHILYQLLAQPPLVLYLSQNHYLLTHSRPSLPHLQHNKGAVFGFQL